MNSKQAVCGLILAGGQARRMGGGDKCLLPLTGKSLLQRTIERGQPQVDHLLLNANGNSLRFARSKLPVVPDQVGEFKGPLAGIHAGLCWMRDADPDNEWMMSFASDTPFFPTDLVLRLMTAAKTHSVHIAVAESNKQMHPTFALWHASLIDVIEKTLEQDKVPSLQDFVKSQKMVSVDFAATHYDPFFNINTPQDLYTAENIAALVEKA
jgi:molybdenum cofactor guanylyltransferase